MYNGAVYRLEGLTMNKTKVLFLRSLVVLFGLCVLLWMLWEPHLEGRNANATVFQIYFGDPFLAYVYVGSIPFFVALYQVFQLISDRSARRARIIKYCSLILVAVIAGAEAYFFLVQRGTEDIAGGVVIGLVLILVSVAVATVAIIFERRFRR